MTPFLAVILIAIAVNLFYIGVCIRRIWKARS